MMLTPSKLVSENPLAEISVKDELSLDDDLTKKLQSSLLPLEIQLMLVPMWTVRSDYHSCMQPLDGAMEMYMNYRHRLLQIDETIHDGTATNTDIVTAFDQVFSLYNVYEQNQKDLISLMKQVNHQILFYSHATKDDLMWNEMLKLKEIDSLAFTRRTCCFEHAVVSLFKLDESIRDSLQTSQDISRCCANYLVRIAQHLTSQFPSENEQEGVCGEIQKTWLGMSEEARD